AASTGFVTKTGTMADSKRAASVAVLCVLSIAATLYFCRSMAGGMPMPGGWTMSMAWMRMPGQGWPAAAAMFLAMWLSMMVAMMLPSAAPMFFRYRHAAFVGLGYFSAWFVLGIPVYVVGIGVASAAMGSSSFSRTIPFLAGATVIVAGIIQLLPSKM